jgi:hypothetical protein
VGISLFGKQPVLKGSLFNDTAELVAQPLLQGGGRYGGIFAGNGEAAASNFAGAQAVSAAANTAVPNPYEYSFTFADKPQHNQHSMS